MDGHRRMILIVWLFFTLFVAGAQSQIPNGRSNPKTQNQGFINIDCGVDEDYLDETTGLQYKSDKNFVSTGQNAYVLPEYNTGNDNLDKLYRSLRYFPEGVKNCYPLKPEQGKNNNYLIRALFSYGNYDLKNQTPKFDLYIGVDYRATIEFDGIDDFFLYDTYHFSLSDIIFVCLINTGAGIPLISGLELKPLNNSIYRTDSGFAINYQTYDAGSPCNALNFKNFGNF